MKIGTTNLNQLHGSIRGNRVNNNIKPTQSGEVQPQNLLKNLAEIKKAISLPRVLTP